MKVILYGVILGLGASVLYLANMLGSAPTYNEQHMRSAYLQGCTLGSRIASELNKEKCELSADMFFDSLSTEVK